MGVSISARAWTLALAAMLLVSFGFQGGATAQDAGDGGAETWTFMVYMSGDSSLSGQMPSDLQEMKKVGSGDGLEIIVLTDGPEAGDSGLSRILPGGREEIPLTHINATWGSELNMGDPEVLGQFVTWAADSYRSDRLMLDLWGHGSGWPGVSPDKGDYLTAPELREAMLRISGAGITLDIVSMDACQMGQVEIAYELRHAADYALLSQKDVPLSGWPYDIFLGHLKGNGTVTEKAAAMVDSYITWGREGNSLYSLTLSLIDLGEIEGLVRAMDTYSSEAALMTGYFNPEFIAARGNTEKYDGDSQYDLAHLLQNINSETGCLRLEGFSEAVFGSMEASIVHEKHWTNLLDEPAENAHGLSIWFPARGPTPDYLGTAFAGDTAWPDFLDSLAPFFRQSGRIQEEHDVTVASLDSDGDGLQDSVRIVHGERTTGTSSIEIYGPDGSIFREIALDTGTAGSMDILLGSPGYYKAAVYLRDSKGVLLNHSLVHGLAKEGICVISGRVISNAGRGLAWVGVSLVDGSNNVLLQAFTDNTGHYRMEIVVPRDTDGKGLRLVCGLGSGQKNITLGTLEESVKMDFTMDVSSAYMPWAVRAIGFMNLAGLMALVYWVAWGRERRPGNDTENLIEHRSIPPTCDSMPICTSTDDIPPPQAGT